MGKIVLHTAIKAPITICFDLARSADVHLASTSHTREKAVAGRTTGLFGLHDEVTWEAVHLGFRQRLGTRITGYNPPYFFEDRMTRGIFKRMQHEHHFKVLDGQTIMTDIFEYEAPLGILGRLFDRLYLKRYMTGLLLIRNSTIKNMAEMR